MVCLPIYVYKAFQFFPFLFHLRPSFSIALRENHLSKYGDCTAKPCKRRHIV